MPSLTSTYPGLPEAGAMTKSLSISLFIALAAVASAADARQEGEKLAECVDLPAGYEAARFGSQYLLVRDNDDYFRIDLGKSCNAIALSSNVKISTKGEANRICPTDTRVSSKHSRCDAREVVRIDQSEYRKYAKRR